MDTVQKTPEAVEVVLHIIQPRLILNICWQDRITSVEVLERAELTSIETTMFKAQL